MEIPSADPTGYCRLCFTQHQLRWVLESSDNPMVAQIQTCLGVALTPEVDFPCSVCRLCSAALETFEALQERAIVCDALLKNSRVEWSEAIDLDVVECKQECDSPEPEMLNSELEIVDSEPMQDSPSPVVVQEEPNGNANTLSSSNTIMVGDIKIELLNVRAESNMVEAKEKPTKQISRKFVCQYCQLAFSSKTYLQKHVNVKHSSTNSPEAVAAAISATRLRHPQNWPGEFKPISPKEIRKQMDEIPSPKFRFKRRVANPPHYCCNMCSAQFTQWQPFMRHRKTHGNVDGAGHAGTSVPNVPSS